MNKYLLLAIVFALLAFPSIILAANIQTGNSSAQSTVTNSVNGSGYSIH